MASSSAIQYDPFGFHGGTTGVAKGTTRTNSTGGTSKSNAGVYYDPFGFHQSDISTPIPAAKPQPQQKTAPSKPQPSLLQRAGGVAKSVGKATSAVVKPVADVVTGKEGKAAHDTAQLSQDVTGGAPNYLLKTDIVNPIKELAAKTPQQKQKAVQQSDEELGLGKSGKDIKSGLKKAGAEAVLTGTLVAGGGEAAGAKSLLAKGVKVAGKQAVKDAAIGASGNAAATVAGNPNASVKQVGKSAAVGGLLGAVAPHAIKVAGDTGRAVAEKAGNIDNKTVNTVKAATSRSAPAKSLIQNQRVKALVDAGQKQSEAETPVINAKVNPDHVAQGLVKPEIKQTPISQIAIPADKEAKIDSQKVGQYVKQIKDGEPIEPVTTHQIGTQTTLVDGQHRIEAAKKLGITEVPTVEKVPGATPLPKESTGTLAPTGKISDDRTNLKGASGNAATPKAQPEVPVEAPRTTASEPSVNSTPSASITDEAASNKEPTTPKAAEVSTPVTTKAVVDPNAPPEQGTSKIAQDIQTKAVAKNLSDNYGEMTQYSKINVANEADKAVKFVNGDKDTLDKVISGEKPLPDGLRATSVVTAIEEHPEYGKDGSMLRALAKSPLNAESSRSAQELRLAAERDTNSPVAKIQELSKARQDAFQKRSGKTAAKATNDEVRQIREAVPKPKVSKETFASFVDSLKC